MKKHANFTVLFVTRTTRTQNKSSESLYARITVDGERVEISLGKNISSGLFNSKSQRCLSSSREAKEINDFLSIINGKISIIRRDLILEDKTITAELIRTRFKRLPDPDEIPNPSLLELYQTHNQKFKELSGTKDHSESTYQRHLTSISHVKEFINKVYKKHDLTFEQLNYKFLNDYEHYLKAVRKCNHNSTMKYIKNLGKVIRIAIAEGYLNQNPFDKFKLTYEQVSREILTQPEIDKMVNLEIEEDRLDRIRDMFFFCTSTGIAFIDVQKLEMKHIYEDKTGMPWIKNKRFKTSIEFMVPVLDITKKIIEKYTNHPQRLNKGFVIPQISNQNYNAYLKELALLCKIKKNLTSHIARHTFATTITLENGVPLEIVSKMLGHTNIKTTQIYAKVQEKAILNGMRNLLIK